MLHSHNRCLSYSCSKKARNLQSTAGYMCAACVGTAVQTALRVQIVPVFINLTQRWLQVWDVC